MGSAVVLEVAEVIIALHLEVVALVLLDHQGRGIMVGLVRLLVYGIVAAVVVQRQLVQQGLFLLEAKVEMD